MDFYITGTRGVTPCWSLERMQGWSVTSEVMLAPSFWQCMDNTEKSWEWRDKNTVDIYTGLSGHNWIQMKLMRAGQQSQRNNRQRERRHQNKTGNKKKEGDWHMDKTGDMTHFEIEERVSVKSKQGTSRKGKGKKTWLRIGRIHSSLRWIRDISTINKRPKRRQSSESFLRVWIQQVYVK